MASKLRLPAGYRGIEARREAGKPQESAAADAGERSLVPGEAEEGEDRR
jgi:hypothetical protein